MSTDLLQTTRWDVFTALDLITEIVLVVLPVYQLWSLQMPLKKKAVVLVAFYLRLPVIGISIGRLVYTRRLCQRDIDPGLDSALVLIWMQVEVTYAIVSSTFSALRGFTINFNSKFGFGFLVNAGPESYNMSRLKRSQQSHSKGSEANTSQTGDVSAEQKLNNTKAATGSVKRLSIQLEPHPAQHYTQISAKSQRRSSAEHGSREDRSLSTERTADDGGITREPVRYHQRSKHQNDRID
jgi:hypothetical protein